MNPNEIKKALECCTRLGCSDNETADCPLKPFEDCSTILARNTLAYINQLEVENNRLINQISELYTSNDIHKIVLRKRNEAIKEFAERLKALLPNDGMSPEGRFKFGRIKSLDIDNLVKERVGDEK